MQFFTWDAAKDWDKTKHSTVSWWKYFEDEIPRLAQMGVTQVWLPPPNKAAVPVSPQIAPLMSEYFSL